MLRIRLILLLIGLIVLVLPAYAQFSTPQAAGSKSDLTITTAKGETHVFHVEYALTPLAQEQGLMFRKSMLPDAGMLFVFPDEQEREFWMENTLIPLDMLFIQADGTIHSIAPNAKPGDLTPVPSHGAVKAVLEINGGMAAKLGLHPGAHVDAGNYFKR